MTRQTAPLPGEQPWVPDPVDGDLLWPRRTIYGGEATWTRYRGAHKPCDMCVEVLHDHGRQPYPRQPPSPAPATMRRNGPNGSSHHCSRHGTEYQTRDRQIQTKLDEMRATAAHMGRSRSR